MSRGSIYSKVDPNIRIRKAPSGKLLVQDVTTGETLCREKKPERNRRGYRIPTRRFEFSDPLAETILGRLEDGEFLAHICDDEGMPSRQSVLAWRTHYPDFGELYREAVRVGREVRAERSAMRLLEIADGPTIDKNDAPGERLKADIHMWNAGVSDPDHYGKSTKVVGDPNRPIQIVVSTGFPEPNAHQKHPELGDDGLVKKPTQPQKDSP